MDVGVRVCVTVAVADGVSVCVGVDDGPVVGVLVTVGTLVLVAVAVAVDAVVAVALPVAVSPTVAVAVLVAVSPTVAVAVALAVVVTVTVGCTDPTVIWPFDGSQVGEPSFSRQPFDTLGTALKVSGVIPLPTPVKVIMNSEPPVGEFTGVVQASVIVTRPAWVRLTVGALQVLTTVPSWTSLMAAMLAMA